MEQNRLIRHSTSRLSRDPGPRIYTECLCVSNGPGATWTKFLCPFCQRCNSSSKKSIGTSSSVSKNGSAIFRKLSSRDPFLSISSGRLGVFHFLIPSFPTDLPIPLFFAIYNSDFKISTQALSTRFCHSPNPKKPFDS